MAGRVPRQIRNYQFCQTPNDQRQKARERRPRRAYWPALLESIHTGGNCTLTPPIKRKIKAGCILVVSDTHTNGQNRTGVTGFRAAPQRVMEAFRKANFSARALERSPQLMKHGDNSASHCYCSGRQQRVTIASRHRSVNLGLIANYRRLRLFHRCPRFLYLQSVDRSPLRIAPNRLLA